MRKRRFFVICIAICSVTAYAGNFGSSVQQNRFAEHSNEKLTRFLTDALNSLTPYPKENLLTAIFDGMQEFGNRKLAISSLTTNPIPRQLTKASLGTLTDRDFVIVSSSKASETDEETLKLLQDETISRHLLPRYVFPLTEINGAPVELLLDRMLAILTSKYHSLSVMKEMKAIIDELQRLDRFKDVMITSMDSFLALTRSTKFDEYEFENQIKALTEQKAVEPSSLGGKVLAFIKGDDSLEKAPDQLVEFEKRVSEYRLAELEKMYDSMDPALALQNNATYHQILKLAETYRMGILSKLYNQFLKEMKIHF